MNKARNQFLLTLVLLYSFGIMMAFISYALALNQFFGPGNFVSIGGAIITALFVWFVNKSVTFSKEKDVVREEVGILENNLNELFNFLHEFICKEKYGVYEEFYKELSVSGDDLRSLACPEVNDMLGVKQEEGIRNSFKGKVYITNKINRLIYSLNRSVSKVDALYKIGALSHEDCNEIRAILEVLKKEIKGLEQPNFHDFEKIYLSQWGGRIFL